MKTVVYEKRVNDPNFRVFLTNDGVHMNPLGNIVMAKGVLRTLGFDEAMIEKSEDAWDAKSIREMIHLDMTLEEYKKYAALPERKKVLLWRRMKELLVSEISH
jgi:hypothetical protein